MDDNRQSTNRADTALSRIRERGAAALILMFLLVFAGIIALAKAYIPTSSFSIRCELNSKTLSAIADGKQAITDYVTTYSNSGSLPQAELQRLVDNGVSAPTLRLGELPCPDMDGDGFSDYDGDGVEVGGTAETNSYTCDHWLGWYPYKSLGSLQLSDACGQPLWYGVSSSHQTGSSTPINSDSIGELMTASESDLVAVVLAPGNPIQSQNRGDLQDLYADSVLSHADKVAQYLEGENADQEDPHTYGTDGFYQFVDGTNPNVTNDRLETISASEIMAIVEPIILQEATSCLENYAAESNGKYPWAAQPGVSTDEPPFTATCGAVFGRFPESLLNNIAHDNGPDPVCEDSDNDGDFADEITIYQTYLTSAGCDSFLEYASDGTCRDNLLRYADCRKKLPVQSGIYEYGKSCDLSSSEEINISDPGSIDYDHTSLEELAYNILVYSPQPSAGCNLVSNGDFDDNDESVWLYNTTNDDFDDTELDSSNRSTDMVDNYLVVQNKTDGGIGIAYQPLSVTTGNTYQISFYYRNWSDDSVGRVMVGTSHDITMPLKFDWLASTGYAVGDIVTPTIANGHYYKCISAGTSDASEPTWPTDGSSVVEVGGGG